MSFMPPFSASTAFHSRWPAGGPCVRHGIVCGGLAAIVCLAASCSGKVEEIHSSVEAAGGVLADVEVAATDWPWWRGTARDGKAAAQDVPIEWSETKNVVWRADVPGRGHGSPTVWGDRVFLATCDETAETQSLLAFDRATGKPLWTTRIHDGPLMHRHEKNSHASASAACDGERVFVVFMADDGIWVTATDLDGEIVWQTKAGDFVSKHGYGASPLIYKSLVIVPGDHTGGSYLTALHRKTGEIVWRTARPNEASFATPIVAEVCGRTQLLVSGCNQVTSYDPESGKLVWWCGGPADTTAATIATDGEHAIASGGYPQKEILCIRGDGEGDVSATHVSWRTNRNATYVPSPLVSGERTYIVDDNGIFTSYITNTGKIVWQKRLSGGFSASPVLCGDRLFLTNESGTTYVIRAADEFEQLAANQLGDAGFASPVICGGQIFLRTGDGLYCIASATP